MIEVTDASAPSDAVEKMMALAESGGDVAGGLIGISLLQSYGQPLAYAVSLIGLYALFADRIDGGKETMNRLVEGFSASLRADEAAQRGGVS